MQPILWYTPQEVAVMVGGVTAAFIRAELRAGVIVGELRDCGKSKHWFIPRTVAEGYVTRMRGSLPPAGMMDRAVGRPCPRCRSRSRVLEVRHYEDTDTTRRRRECLSCRYRWTTREIDDQTPQVA